ncbi:MAG: HAMP domain-containing histidine kinase, partial [Candidatus Obscuribacterales bacterium]|nr:HAMP domain-containing histidine kinase [Candidatus Obscuribacterales bacterium]
MTEQKSGMHLFDKIQSLAEALSVRHKGLLLVSIPLAFQLLFTLSLGLLYSQAETEARKESQARLLTIRVNTIIKDFWDAGEYLFAATLLDDDDIAKRWAAKKAQVFEELDSLKRTSMDSAESAKAYGSMLTLSNRGISMMEKVMLKLRTSGVRSNIFYEIKPFLDALAKDMEENLTADVKRRANGLLSEESSRKLIANLLYFSLIADLAIALALSLFFATSIAKRLAIISDNTKKMRAKQELNPALSGIDEIAHLDQEFHELAEALNNSESLRREFLAMTSHDLKTPLMSVELSLELIEQELSDTDSGTVKEEIRSAKTNMQRVLSLINDLLDLERGASGKLNLELEELEADDLIKRSCRSVQALADHKKISLVIEAESAEITGDRRRL